MKYHSIILLFAFISGFFSCDLEEYNPSGTTAEIVFSTPAGYEKLVNAAYVNLRKEIYGREDVVFMTEAGTDLWFNAAKASYNKSFAQYDGLGYDNKTKNPWNRNYDPINLCNAAINRIDQANYTDTVQRDSKVAEVHFLRAFYYWNIVEHFGNVTLTSTETSGPILTRQRSKISEFYQVITADLEFACKHLPLIQSDAGRPARKAAYHLLSRIYLTMANYCEMPTEMKDHLETQDMTTAMAMDYYQKALDAAEYLINNKATLNASLYPTFAEVFVPANNKTNSEAIFVVTHSTVDALNPQTYPNRLHQYYQCTYNSYCGMNTNLTDGYSNPFLMPTRYLLTVFDSAWDARYAGSFKEVYRCNYTGTALAPKYKWKAADITMFRKTAPITTTKAITNGDTALYFTRNVVPNKATCNYGVVDINDLYQDTIINNVHRYIISSSSQNKFFPSLTKFADPDRSDASSSAGHKDVILFRFGETYLLAAEAAYGLTLSGGPNKLADAVNYINTLRERSCMNKTTDYVVGRAKITEADLSVDFFLDERARELCGEHLRWFDLKRYAKLGERIEKNNPDITKFQAFHILRPIPQQELEALINREEYGQNKGY